MFADSLLDSPYGDRSQRSWSTFTSFVVQALIVGGLLLLPLIYTSGLPQIPLLAPLLVIAPSSAPPSTAPAHTANQTASRQNTVGMVVPRTVPRKIETGNEPAIPAAPEISSIVSRGLSDASGDEVWQGLGTGFNVTPPPPKPVAPAPRISRMMEGNLIYRVQPEYPALAKSSHVQGTVLLHAVISGQGTIENLHVVSGSPLLIEAAVEAVRQWRYRPYLLNGEPVEVDTQITVNFLLGGG